MDQQRSLRPREERNYTIENEGFSSKCENETLKKRKSFKNPKTMPEIFAEFIQNTNSLKKICDEQDRESFSIKNQEKKKGFKQVGLQQRAISPEFETIKQSLESFSSSFQPLNSQIPRPIQPENDNANNEECQVQIKKVPRTIQNIIICPKQSSLPEGNEIFQKMVGEDSTTPQYMLPTMQRIVKEEKMERSQVVSPRSRSRSKGNSTRNRQKSPSSYSRSRKSKNQDCASN